MTDHRPDSGLLAAILEAVREGGDGGLTEHDLLRRLDAREVRPFHGARLDQPLGLFRAHFLLFHCLYHLDEALAAEGERLRIHCLDIAIETGPGGRTAAGGDALPEQADPLRAYYLDLANLDGMDAAGVEALLDDFWRRFDRRDRRREALQVLELEDPVDDAAIQRQFRRLAQRAHPDKGGTSAALQRLNEARLILVGEGV